MTAITKGIHHLGLSVPDINETANFFIEELGFQLLGEKPEYPAKFVGDGTVMLTLWQILEEPAVSFNRRQNVGLHHFAMFVESFDQLQSTYERLAQHPGVQIEFGPEALGAFPLRHTIMIIPGGIRFELVAPVEAV